MKTYYTFEMAFEDCPATAAHIRENLNLRNEICFILENAGSEGMTPTQLNEAIDRKFYPEYEYGYYSLQKIVGNARTLIAKGIIERRVVDTGAQVVVQDYITYRDTYKPTENGLFKRIPAGTHIEKKIPEKKVIYVWVG